MRSAPTDRLSALEAVAPPVEHHGSDLTIERRVLMARTTLVGLCLTAFACGIITTVALERHHVPAQEREVRAQADVVRAAAQTAPVVAEAAPKPAPPVVVELPAEAANPIREPAVAPPIAAARTPRPAAPHPAARRRPANPPVRDEPAKSPPRSPDWVDPFAE